MGYKIHRDANALPVELKNGVLTVFADDVEFSTEIKAIKTITFTKQCTQFKGENITCYLMNEHFKVVLRSDGTGTFMLLGSTIILVFNWEPIKVPNLKYTEVGCYHRDGMLYSKTKIYFWDKEKLLISVDDYPDIYVFNRSDYPDFVKYIATFKNSLLPKMSRRGGRLLVHGSDGLVLMRIDCFSLANDGFKLL